MEYNITPVDFVNTLYPELPENEAVCLAKPSGSGFSHYPATERKLKQIHQKPDEYYLCVSTVTKADTLRRRKTDCRAAYVFMLDDIGTKAQEPPVSPTAILETSRNNFQYLYALDPFPFASSKDIGYYEACLKAVAAKGYGDSGALEVNRVFRLPGSINTKEGKHLWPTSVVHWDPEAWWTLDELMTAMGVNPGEYVEAKPEVTEQHYHAPVPDGFTDPVLDWLQEQGLLGQKNGDFFDIKCPWADQHTTGKDTAGYSPLGCGKPAILRGFHCFHGHCADKTARDFLAWVQSSGGPGVEISGIGEVSAAVLQEQKKQLSQSERVTVLYASLPSVWKSNLPDVVRSPTGIISVAQRPTRPNIQYLIDTLGVHTRMNMQTHKAEFFFNHEPINEFIDHEEETVRCILDAGQRCGMGGVTAEFMKVASEMSLNDRYHPMADWILSKPWDGVQRFEPLLGAAGVEKEYEKIWPVYLKRWLVQGVQAVMGWKDPQQMRACLVLAGAQNIGKSRLFASLVPLEFFLEGAHIELHGSAAKDSIMQTTGYPIVELGELETTFSKSATGQLKAFMALRKDTYRAPYDIRAREWPRCTSFCGSVNKRDFLVDETGSTRFWPVWVDWVNPDHGIDTQQLWAQVFTWWQAGEKWWLTPEEDKIRGAQAEDFEVVRAVDEAAIEWLVTHKWPGTGMNVTAFARMIDVSPTNQNLSFLKSVLTRFLGKPKCQIKGVRNAWDIPTTPGNNVKITGKLGGE